MVGVIRQEREIMEKILNQTSDQAVYTKASSLH